MALKVQPLSEPAAPDAYETYALAYTTEQQNWSGDRFAADFNADGVVDVTDLIHMVRAWQLHNDVTGQENEPAASLWEDLNGDGRIDQMDFRLFAGQWQYRSPWYPLTEGR